MTSEKNYVRCKTNSGNCSAVSFLILYERKLLCGEKKKQIAYANLLVERIIKLGIHFDSAEKDIILHFFNCYYEEFYKLTGIKKDELVICLDMHNQTLILNDIRVAGFRHENSLDIPFCILLGTEVDDSFRQLVKKWS